MNLAGFAAAVRDLAARAEGGLAGDCAEAAAKDFLATLRAVTPKRSGHLASTETIDSVSGGGAVAVAVVGAHAVYARFRNDGGTITKHSPGSLGTPAVGWFGHSVTQHGAHYFEKAEAIAGPQIRAACQIALARYLTL